MFGYGERAKRLFLQCEMFKKQYDKITNKINRTLKDVGSVLYQDTTNDNKYKIKIMLHVFLLFLNEE